MTMRGFQSPRSSHCAGWPSPMHESKLRLWTWPFPVPAVSAPHRHKSLVFYAKSCVQWWLVVPGLEMHVKLTVWDFVEMIQALVQRLLHLCLVNRYFLFLTTSSLIKPLVQLSDTRPRWRIPSIPCTNITLNLRVRFHLDEPFNTLSFLLSSRHFLLN